MTEAHAEHVPPDPREGLVFLGQARRFAEDGGAQSLSDAVE